MQYSGTINSIQGNNTFIGIGATGIFCGMGVITNISNNNFSNLADGIVNSGVNSNGTQVFGNIININANLLTNCIRGVSNYNTSSTALTMYVSNNTFNNAGQAVFILNNKTRVLPNNSFSCHNSSEIYSGTVSPVISLALPNQINGTCTTGINSVVELYKSSTCSTNGSIRNIQTFLGTATMVSAINWIFNMPNGVLNAGDKVTAVVTPDSTASTGSTSGFATYKMVCTPYTITATPTARSCANNYQGSISLSSAAASLAGYSYNYNGGAAITGNGTTIPNLAAGTYSITATDANGCASTPISATVGTSSAILVTNTNDSGSGSLREAINCSNGHIGADTILFNISGSGQKVITLASALPSLIDVGTVIDGGAWLNTTTPQIRLMPSNSNFTGLNINANDTKVKGLYFDNIYIQNTASNVKIEDNIFNIPNTANNSIGIFNQGNMAIHKNTFLNGLIGINNTGYIYSITDCSFTGNGRAIQNTSSTINTISNNTFSNCTTWAIENQGSIIGTISSNTFSNCNGAILNRNFANQCIINISNNNINNCVMGIQQDHSTQMVVEANTFSNNTTAINLGTGGTQTLIKNTNKFQCNATEIVSPITKPTIISALTTGISGTFTVGSNQLIELYKITNCNSNGSLRTIEHFLGIATLNTSNGTWQLLQSNYQIPIAANDKITAVVTNNASANYNNGGSSAFAISMIAVPPCPNTIVMPTTTVTTCEGTQSLTLTTAPVTGALYVWNNPNGTVIPNSNASSITLTGTATPSMSGLYSVSVYDAGNCLTHTGTVNVTVNPKPTVTTSQSGNTLTASVSGGTAPYNYSWSNGTANTANTTATVAGTYSVTATDANGCTANNSLISCASNVTVSQSNLPNTTSFTFVANPPSGANYTYEWFYLGNSIGTGSSVTYNFNACGTFTVDLKVNVGNACALETVSKQITLNSTISSVNITKTPNTAVCQGTVVTLAASGIGSGQITGFAWSNGTTGNSTSVSSTTAVGPVLYTVTATDNIGCTKTGSTIVTYLAKPTAVIDAVSNPLCYGAATGTANVSVTGGTTPYTYTWSNGATTASVTGLTAGDMVQFFRTKNSFNFVQLWTRKQQYVNVGSTTQVSK